MTSMELIQAGLCDDLVEVFEQFPLEYLDDFAGPVAVCGYDANERVGRTHRGLAK